MGKSKKPSQREFPLDLFESTLPRKPYCTDELGQLFIRPAMQAIRRRFIQPNRPSYQAWFVYDVDRPTAHFDWYDLHAPAPNITAMNRANGHAHLFYGLEVPVHKTPEAKLKPLHYAASIDVALTKKLDADPAYGGLISKNPLNDWWDVKIWENTPYDLDLLADYLDLEPYSDLRKRLPSSGLGRNCTLFDVTRHWAYRKIRTDSFLDMEFFVWECTQYAAEFNTNFANPLPWTEVKSTGKSVGSWTWKHMSRAGFIEWCSRRGKKSGAMRHVRSQERAEEIRAYKLEHPKATTREMGVIFNCGRNTISLALRGK